MVQYPPCCDRSQRRSLLIEQSVSNVQPSPTRRAQPAWTNAKAINALNAVVERNWRENERFENEDSVIVKARAEYRRPGLR